MKAILVSVFLIGAYSALIAEPPPGWPRGDARLPGYVPGRTAPALSAEQVIELARKAVLKQKTQLNKRFLAGVKYISDASKVPEFVREFATGPFWLVTYEDPEHPDDTREQGSRISILVFSSTHVAIVAP